MMDALTKYLEKVKEKKKVKGYMIIPLEYKKIKEDYIMLFQKNIQKIVKEMDLTLTEYKVFLYLLSITDFENFILITQQEMSEELKIKQSNISNALKSLEKKGLIIKERKGRNNFYKINPNIAWKGREKNRKNILQME